MNARPTTVSEAWAINKQNVRSNYTASSATWNAPPHPYCPDEDGRCQHGRDEECPGIGRLLDQEEGK